MAIAGSPIEAILTLDASGFHSGLSEAKKLVDQFGASTKSKTGDINAFATAIDGLMQSVESVTGSLTTFANISKETESFNKFANGVKALASAVEKLSTDSNNASTGLTRVKEVIASWGDALNGIEVKVKGVSTAIKEMTNTQNQGIRVAQQYKLGATNVQSAVTSMSTSLAQGRQNLGLYHQNLKQLALGVEQFNAIETKTQTGVDKTNAKLSQAREKIISMDNALAQGRQNLGLYHQNLKQLALGVEQFNAIETGHITKEREVATATNQATASVQRQATANRTATASTNQLTTATSRLGKAMSSLKMIGTMVGSMLAYNFAHKLLVATGETIHAKSEMEGYFKMLHFGQSDIDDFNNALTETVQQFQRVNKYSLGETISSIGVEFNLTTEEMKKAMKVTSMITSEYLRAGRNANEASLAVKDVLQGQFQRLSRETGVKGEQLKEAGWSGDTTDVLGLMEALEKVGESRNWDVFAEKANSLNDILTILQNRFGEWSAEMVNIVQPSIVNTFNAIMSVGGALSGVLSGLWQWVNGDGLVESAVRWTGIATAIGTAVTALVHYRTGANLVQMVQMGLRGSIMATIFQLKAEEVATYGSRNALIAKITSLKAEQVATMGVRNAILTKVLGLNAEMVANNGLKGAIMASTFARQLEEAETAGATATQRAKIASDQMEQLSNMSTLKTIIAKVAGVNMETFAERGLIVALAQRIAQSPLYIGALEAEEVAELSTAEASLILAGTLAPLIAIIAGIAMGLYALIAPLQQASEQMKGFNDLLNNGEDIVKEYGRKVDSLKNKESQLKEERDKLTAGTEEYLRKEKEISRISKDVETAEKNKAMAYEAYQRTVSANAHFEERRDEIAIHNQTLLADAYEKVGISAEEALKLTSHEMTVAEKGAEQLRQALSRIKWEADRGIETQTKTIDMLDKYGLSDEKIKQYGTALSEANYKVMEGFEKFMTSDDLMERIGGWFEIQQGRLEEWWTELNAFFEVRDWDGIRDKLWEGLKYVLTGFGAFDWMSAIGGAISEKGIVGVIMDALFGEGDSDGIVDIISDWGNKMIVKPLVNWLNWFVKDPVGNFDKIMDDFSLQVGKFLFGKDSPSIRDMVDEWFNTNVVTPILDWINGFASDPLSYIGNGLISVTGWFLDPFVKMMFGDDASVTESLNQIISQLSSIDFMGMLMNGLFNGGEEGSSTTKAIDTTWILSWVNTNIVYPLGSYLYNGIMSIPLVSDILSLFGLVNGENSGASQKGTDIANAFKHKVEDIVRNIPILGDVLQFLGVIPQANPTASSNGQGVGNAIKTGFKNGLTGIVDIIKGELDNIVGAIRGAIDGVGKVASDLGGAIVNGVRSGMVMFSPSIISREILPQEFGVNVPNAIMSSADTVYGVAQSYGQKIVDGVSSVTSNVGLGGMVDSYETDAQIVADSSQMMGIDTTTAFNDMSMAVNQTTSTMSGNVASTYSSMQTKQATSLNTMKTQNLNAYNDMYNKSNQSLIHMRDSTSNITQQMTNAWNHMKDQIVASANKLKNDSTVHFNTLSNTIGSFYRKIQNPSSWGSAGGLSASSNRRNTRVGRAFSSTIKHGAGGIGGTNFTKNTTMSIATLKRKLCPDGSCGDLFNGFNNSDVVNVSDFLSLMIGTGHGFGGWNTWDSTHYNHIKTKSDAWGMKSPTINLAGGIPTNADYKVGDFENGTPKISFSSFQSMAESIFTAIPYRFYYDSNWKGSWLGALQAGACNCWDGANALIAFAQSCGFSGSIVHGTWTDPDGTTYPHVWANINGKKMDTTGWQQRRSWSAGSPNAGASNPSNNQPSVNITVNVENAYGIDDLNSQIEEGIDKGLQKHFNKNMALGV